MAQVVVGHKLLGGWCDPRGGISSGASQMEAEGVLGQNGCILLFHCWFSIPGLAKHSGFQAICIQRQLEKSFDKLHPEMLADTQDRLCYSKIMFTVKWFRDWGIIQHGPTAQHLQKYQIPNDSWQQESISRSRDSFSFSFFFLCWDKTKLFCSNSAVYKSLIKAIGWFTSGITEVRTIKHGFILQLTHALGYPL